MLPLKNLARKGLTTVANKTLNHPHHFTVKVQTPWYSELIK